VVGNSSSGLLEVPSFKKGTINIGDRQRGRLMARSVINCEPTRHSIKAALVKLYSADFQASLGGLRSPYGEGGASEKIIDVIKSFDTVGIVKKSFYDLPQCGTGVL
jgi:GDP/UDP-N,N'-diacetylbacillosamine 2-epimerase (hydrolysing)